MVGPGNHGDNEVMLIGTAYGVMNANALPSGVVLPPWASEHLAEMPAHNMLLMLRDVDYIGGGQTIPVAKLTGQTSVCNALPPQITEHIRRMKRFHPPIQSQSSTAIWHEGIGPGRKCCVYFNEEEPYATFPFTYTHTHSTVDIQEIIKYKRYIICWNSYGAYFLY